MDLCKAFARKAPIVIVTLTVVFVYAMLKLLGLLPDGPLSFGISESLLAIATFVWTFLFMGKEKVSFKKDGFRYGFRLLRNYLIGMSIFGVVAIGISIYDAKGIDQDSLIRLINFTLVGASVGIAEEFAFRGLVFGGLLQKLGNSKKGIIIAAVVSGFLFGAIHIFGSLIRGEITSWDTVLTAVLKTCESGVFGVVLACIYYRTKNIYVVAALHSLNDYILFLTNVCSKSSGIADSYVGVAGQTTGAIVTYIIFTVVMIPSLIRCIKDIKENEAVPFDDDFEPIAVKFEKKSKLKLA